MAPATSDHRQAQNLARSMQNECLGVRAGRLHRLISRRFDQALRPVGVTLPQMEILSALTIMKDPVKPAYVADKLSVERSTMSRNLTLMEARGMITTTSRSASDRSLAVTLTPLGSETLVRAGAAWTEAQSDVSARLGEEAAEIMDAWTGKLDQSVAPT